eukprot:1157789-Pelagomonas_calceolata.AAC.5
MFRMPWVMICWSEGLTLACVRQGARLQAHAGLLDTLVQEHLAQLLYRPRHVRERQVQPHLAKLQCGPRLVREWQEHNGHLVLLWVWPGAHL